MIANFLIRELNKRPVSATAVAGLVAQMVRPAISIVTLPFLLSYLGTAGLGVWMIALSLMGLVGFFSAGLSASVVTAVSKAKGSQSLNELKSVATAATILAAAFGALTASIGVPLALLIDWSVLLRIQSSDVSGDDVEILMAILALTLAFSLVSAVPRQIMLGRMHGYISHLLTIVGILVGGLGLIAGILLKAPLWALAGVFVSTPILTNLLGGLLYLRHEKLPLFSISYFDKEIYKNLRRESLQMAGYQGAYAISSQSDLLIIGALIGAPAAAAYGVAQRIFSFIMLVAASVNYAQWPELSRCEAAGEHEKTARIFRRTLLIGTGLSTITAVLLAAFYTPVVTIWLGQPIEADQLLLIGMVTWVVVITLTNTADTLLRARGEMALLMKCMASMAILNVGLTLLLIHWIGAAGAIWGTVLGSVLALLIPYSMRLHGMWKPKRELPQHHNSGSGAA